MARQILFMSLLAISCIAVVATDPLQDFCVADLTSPARVNGQVCVDSKLVQASHFSLNGLHLAGNVSNPFGSKVTPIFVGQLPALNTLGVAMARIDYAPWGLVPPHMHPRASEILTVIEGTLLVGFVTSNPENRHITKTLYKGDVFVFPIGLPHYQQNVGNGYAVSISGLSNQNPGVITIANTLFGPNPTIPDDILVKAFQVDKTIITTLQSRF